MTKLRNTFWKNHNGSTNSYITNCLHCRLRSWKAHANGRNKSQRCCVLLGDFGQQCCVRLNGPKSLTNFKLYATSVNIVVVPCMLGPTMLCQQSANIVVVPYMLDPTMLCVVCQQCFVRLHGPLYTIFKFHRVPYISVGFTDRGHFILPPPSTPPRPLPARLQTWIPEKPVQDNVTLFCVL